MLKKIQEQNKTIQYIKKIYKEKTGEEVMMPMSWQDYLEIPQEDTPSQPLPLLSSSNQQEIKSFRVQIDKLNLPSRINAAKTPLTSFVATNKFHMVQTIDLSGFKDCGFSKIIFRQFLSRIVEMRALHALSLRKNGIDDSCVQQIQTMLSIKRISRIDLSSNKMGKSCLQIISKNFGHIQWIDLSRNYFLYETYAIQSLINSVRTNGKIWHLCIDIQQSKQLNQLCGYMKIKPQLHSLGLVDSHIDLQSIKFICNVLDQSSSGKKVSEARINYLNFEYCYLQRKVFDTFLQSVSGNSTLIVLNLSHNNLGNQQCTKLCKILQSNISIMKLNISANMLTDQIGSQLLECLSKNQILQVVDIGKNNIGTEGGKHIYECLSTKNDTLQGLGQFETNTRMGQELIQKIKKALKINKVSKEIRSKIMAQDSQLSSVEISNRQTEAFLQSQYKQFDLLVPIALSNPLRNNLDEIHVWNLQ